LLPSYCLQTIICEKSSESFSALFKKMSAAEAAMNSLTPERSKSAYQATNLKFDASSKKKERKKFI
jgi:hypothetical protein